jgi:glycosyltransferase involved in cell wall biosynthesis
VTRLLFVTQQVDPAHPVLATTIPKLRAVARRVDELVVLTDRTALRAEEIAPNARVRTFGAGSRAGRGLRFERALLGELAGLRGGAVLAHQCPVYAVLAAPFVRPLRIPMALWYAHWAVTPVLRAAEKAVTAVVTTAPDSFLLPSRKVVVVGQAIVVDALPCRPPRAADGTLRAVVVGRYSPAKGLEEVVRAAAAVPGVELDVHGPASDAVEQATKDSLGRLVAELGAGDRVRLDGALDWSRLPEVFAGADVLVNNHCAGAPDQIVFEAAASCLPALASNPSFASLLPRELRFDRDEPGALAARLAEQACLPQDERTALGRQLRERVRADHSVDGWAERVLAAVGL